MSVENSKKHTTLSWVFVVLLVGLCAALGALQYRSIGEVSRAEQDKLRANLQSNLQRIREDFNSEVNTVGAAFSQDLSSGDAEDRQNEIANRFARWRASSGHPSLIRRVAMATPQKDKLDFELLDLEAGTFAPADWPSNWSAMRQRLSGRAFGDAPGNADSGSSVSEGPALIEVPHFSRRMFEEERGRDRRGPPEPRRELAWTIIELDGEYLRATVIPELLLRHLGSGGKLDYHAEVAARGNPALVLYDSDPATHARTPFRADASVGLFEPVFFPAFNRGGRFGRGPGNRSGPRDREAFGNPRDNGRGPGPNGGGDRGRWLLSVQHRAGSLEALVEQSRRRSLAVTGGILLLMLVTVGALVVFTRRAQTLAELQMEFVASVSHELRTPLTVIRTAAHNLSAKLVSNANQVQRYGALIEDQSEKLADLIDRVLLFSNAKAGRVIHTLEAMSVDLLIEEALSASTKIVEESGCVLEKNIDPNLPPIHGDHTALKHALLNLIANAAKYGSSGRWIGVSAGLAESKPETVEIRVSDHGAGIPSAELGHIFDSFYRGKVAIADQIHGTGLGLSLVKRIVKAHGGTVEVESEPGKLTEFIVRIPAAPAERVNEFEDSVSRR